MTDPQTSKENRKSTSDTRTDARHTTAESDRGAANAIPSYAQSSTEAPVIPKSAQTNAMRKSAQAKDAAAKRDAALLAAR